jgi:hypothetical protein
MAKALQEAYKIIFGKDPAEGLQEREIGREVIEHFDGRKRSEDLAKECVFRVVNHTIFPNSEVTREVVGRAEDIATELFPELEGVDPHMDVIAHLERVYHEKKEQKEREKMSTR